MIHRLIQHMKLKHFVGYRVCIREQSKIWTAGVEVIAEPCVP